MYREIDTASTRGRKYALCKPDLTCQDVAFKAGTYPTMAACQTACTSAGRPAVIDYMRRSIASDPSSVPEGAYVRNVLAEHERDLARENPAAARIQALARGMKARRQADLARRAAALRPMAMPPAPMEEGLAGLASVAPTASGLSSMDDAMRAAREEAAAREAAEREAREEAARAAAEREAREAAAREEAARAAAEREAVDRARAARARAAREAAERAQAERARAATQRILAEKQGVRARGLAARTAAASALEEYVAEQNRQRHAAYQRAIADLPLSLRAYAQALHNADQLELLDQLMGAHATVLTPQQQEVLDRVVEAFECERTADREAPPTDLILRKARAHGLDPARAEAAHAALAAAVEDPAKRMARLHAELVVQCAKDWVGALLGAHALFLQIARSLGPARCVELAQLLGTQLKACMPDGAELARVQRVLEDHIRDYEDQTYVRGRNVALAEEDYGGGGGCAIA